MRVLGQRCIGQRLSRAKKGRSRPRKPASARFRPRTGKNWRRKKAASALLARQFVVRVVALSIEVGDKGMKIGVSPNGGRRCHGCEWFYRYVADDNAQGEANGDVGREERRLAESARDARFMGLILRALVSRRSPPT
jgi:hypothetical protein